MAETLGPPEPGAGQRQLRCTEWTAADEIVTCDRLSGQGYLPAVTYRASTERYVAVSTLHSNIDVATYATNYSQGKDVGYAEPPLPQEEVAVSGSFGLLTQAADGTQRVVWSPVSRVLVAVEAGPGVSRNELLSIAGAAVPTSEEVSIPLVLASTGGDIDGHEVTAVGGVINGEICLAAATGCITLRRTTSEASATDAVAISAQATDFGVAGIVTGDIVHIEATLPDGSVVMVEPMGQSIGTTRAFVLIADTAVTLQAFDAAGNPRKDVEPIRVSSPVRSATTTAAVTGRRPTLPS